MRLVLLSFFCTFGFINTVYSQNDLLENLSITDSQKLQELEKRGFSIGDLILKGNKDGVLNNHDLFNNQLLSPVLSNLKLELTDLAQGHKEKILFDQNYLNAPDAKFILAGVINRADHGYKYQNLCGEVRFIFRLAYSKTDNQKSIQSKLPVTLNVIFKGGLNNENNHCADLAQAWLNMNLSSSTSDWLNSGPLSKNFFSYENLDSLEFNIQAVREGSENSENFAGKAQYLLKVFKWVENKFEESVLENQIDRDMLLANPIAMKDFKNWILASKNLKSLDDGTILVPKKFLAKRAVSIAPGGLARSGNRPYYKLFNNDELKDISFEDLDLIKSKNGLLRRLNDTTCTGCHQTRAIGGFHFTGLDPIDKYRGNSVFLPGSPHFSGDLPRRKLILQDIAKNLTDVDFSRGFAARPQAHRSNILNNTGLLNAWGAHCATGDDKSFKDWTCSGDLVCTQLLDHTDDSGMGVCLDSKQKIGSPCEFGTVKNISFNQDQFTRTNNREIFDLDSSKTLCSPQSQDPGTLTGGFLNGSIRTLTCDNLPSEAACGANAATGFNNCIENNDFVYCLNNFSNKVGLRACDLTNPCRDDYICAESFTSDRGVCIPPYFIFQMRVDGHPAAIKDFNDKNQVKNIKRPSPKPERFKQKNNN